MNIYTRNYLENLLDILTDNLEDLGTWSAYNQDLKIEEITQLTELYELIKKQLLT